MSEVKRFSGNYIPGHPPAIVTDPNGLLCLYSELEVERLAHVETKEKLRQAKRWIESVEKFGAETKLAYDVLSDEFNEMESDLKDEIKALEKRLAELEDAIEQSVETGKDALWWKLPWVENQIIQQAIQNS